MDGQHPVLSRKDFTFKNETFKTAKIILQSIKPIIDFHTSYICGNPITISGDTGEVSAINAVYKKGAYNKLNYDIANNIYTYGNAYEYVYRDESGTIRSKLINVEDGYPIYNQYGEYVSFIEYWNDVVTNEEHSILGISKYSLENQNEWQEVIPNSIEPAPFVECFLQCCAKILRNRIAVFQ